MKTNYDHDRYDFGSRANEPFGSYIMRIEKEIDNEILESV